MTVPTPHKKLATASIKNDDRARTRRAYTPDLFLNRELSWLKFNWRVLNEACDKRTPLLDQVKFLAIVSSNLDEFCMKRIGGLRLQLDAGLTKPTIDGRSPAEQIDLCAREMEKLGQAKENAFKTTRGKLEKKGIYIRPYSSLSKGDKQAMRD
ncbi:MAG TPA: RNA degradosome polyphosphate kinase, partial [Hellea balneolensis]|nr:RNA degradosome polyphosphate kinase [Hellea balneolensis]